MSLKDDIVMVQCWLRCRRGEDDQDDYLSRIDSGPDNDVADALSRLLDAGYDVKLSSGCGDYVVVKEGMVDNRIIGTETGEQRGDEMEGESGSETGDETGDVMGDETGDETGEETGDETGSESGDETGDDLGD